MSADTALSPWGARFVAKKAMFTFLGAAFRIFGPEGNLQFFVKQKAFKLKEELTVFADEGQTRPMLRIQARRRMDFSATYDVVDANTNEAVGALKRMGMKSMFRDEWEILAPNGDEVIGKIVEDSGVMALVRRFLIKIIPQTFHVTVGGTEAGIVKQRFNFFALTYDVDFTQGAGLLDPRMGVAAVVLLLAIEGRQQ
jgi:uncharacterized protein YxjI